MVSAQLYCRGDDKVEQARALLTAHHAHAIEHFGAWVITDLPQEDGYTRKA
jgi:hypothetical protein